jgi:hypothetical protein
MRAGSCSPLPMTPWTEVRLQRVRSLGEVHSRSPPVMRQASRFRQNDRLTAWPSDDRSKTGKKWQSAGTFAEQAELKVMRSRSGQGRTARPW